jgi:hypothetical protein
VFIIATVASICAVLLACNLIALACRHRTDLWFTSEDAILCVVSPAMILLLTLGGVALGYRLTHGGLVAVSTGAWTGVALVLVVFYALWRVLSARLLAGGPRSGAGATTVPMGSPTRVPG